MKKILPVITALVMFSFAAHAQNGTSSASVKPQSVNDNQKTSNTTINKKPVSGFSGSGTGTVDAKSAKPKVAPAMAVHKPTNNLGGLDIGQQNTAKAKSKGKSSPHLGGQDIGQQKSKTPKAATAKPQQ